MNENNIDILVLFGSRIRELRHAAELSQEAFADKCGLDRTYIGGIERGERNLGLRNIALLAKALNVSLSELMEGLP
jgi:transcriptional regulator with XRE-family HTH domain